MKQAIFNRTLVQGWRWLITIVMFVVVAVTLFLVIDCWEYNYVIINVPVHTPSMVTFMGGHVRPILYFVPSSTELLWPSHSYPNPVCHICRTLSCVLIGHHLFSILNPYNHCMITYILTHYTISTAIFVRFRVLSLNTGDFAWKTNRAPRVAVHMCIGECFAFKAAFSYKHVVKKHIKTSTNFSYFLPRSLHQFYLLVMCCPYWVPIGDQSDIHEHNSLYAPCTMSHAVDWWGY